MNSCEIIRAELDSYLDDELSPNDQRATEAHLADCPECNRLLQERRAAMGMLAEWSTLLAAPAAAAPAVRPARRGALVGALAAAAAIGLAAGGYVWCTADRDTASHVRLAPPGGRLVMRSLADGVKVLPGKSGEPDELVVEAFPLNWRSMSSGVKVIPGKSGGPAELVVDPFPEEGR